MIFFVWVGARGLKGPLVLLKSIARDEHAHAFDVDVILLAQQRFKIQFDGVLQSIATGGRYFRSHLRLDLPCTQRTIRHFRDLSWRGLDEYTELKHIYESHAPTALNWFGP